MVGSDGRGKGLEKKQAGGRRRCRSARLFFRRRYHKMAFRRSGVVIAAACYCVALVFFGDGAVAAEAAPAAAAGGGRGKDAGAVRDSRAGNVAGLENGRISLSKVSKMLTSSVHMEVCAPYCVHFATCFFLVRNEHPFLCLHSPFSSGWWLHHDHRLCVSLRKDIGPFLAQRWALGPGPPPQWSLVAKLCCSDMWHAFGISCPVCSVTVGSRFTSSYPEQRFIAWYNFIFEKLRYNRTSFLCIHDLRITTSSVEQYS